MKTLYHPIEPYQQRMLKVSEIHDIYYEQCGNPDGQPVVFLHGGPGGGIIADYRRCHPREIAYRETREDGCARFPGLPECLPSPRPLDAGAPEWDAARASGTIRLRSVATLKSR
jgi:hypothetical protein